MMKTQICDISLFAWNSGGLKCKISFQLLDSRIRCVVIPQNIYYKKKSNKSGCSGVHLYENGLHWPNWFKPVWKSVKLALSWFKLIQKSVQSGSTVICLYENIAKMATRLHFWYTLTYKHENYQKSENNHTHYM